MQNGGSGERGIKMTVQRAQSTAELHAVGIFFSCHTQCANLSITVRIPNRASAMGLPTFDASVQRHLLPL